MDTHSLCAAMEVPFSDEQLAAITAELAPGVVIAGAGTGKTTVMAARVVWLVGTAQVRPEEVLGLTFTRKAAAELAQRIQQALAKAGLVDEESRERVATYDSFAASLVTEHAIRSGIDHTPQLIDGATAHQLLARVVHDAEDLPLLSQYSVTTIIERVRALDDAMQSHLVESADVRRYTGEAKLGFLNAPMYGKKSPKPYASMLTAAERCDERLELLGLVDQYQELKRKLGVAEFADQLRLAARLVAEHPAIGADLRRRYRLVLLDEYQDTSSAQAKLLTSLFAGHPVTAVGDPFQAIYGWRGAAASNILEFETGFGHSSRVSLGINRRSHSRILDVGNELKSPISSPISVTLVPPEDAQRGLVEAARFDSEDEELAHVVERILTLEGSRKWSDIAVLSRRNATLGVLAAKLRAQGVPTEVVGIGGLLGVPEVAHVVSTLRLLADPSANPALATLLTGPRWGVGLPDMVILARHARELAEDASLLDAAESRPAGLSPHARSALAGFLAEYRRLRSHVGEPVADLVHRIVQESGLEEELRVSGHDLSQLEAFQRACSARPIVAGEETLPGLLSYLDAEETAGIGFEQASVSEANSVKLLTVHRAKGLEWDTVFLVGLAEGLFPARNLDGSWVSAAQQLPAPLRGDADSIPQLMEYSDAALKQYQAELKLEHLQAEDRLAYVAATRAKRLLVGTCHDWSPGAARARKPSRYFEVLAREAAREGHFVDHSSSATANPTAQQRTERGWPERIDEHALAELQAAAELVAQARPGADWVARSGQLPPEEEAQLTAWDEAVAHVLAPATSRDVRLPVGLTATAAIALKNDPQAFAEQLLRRMPRRPSSAATLGTRFHEWVQRRFELLGGLDEAFERAQDPQLAQLIAAFERGQFAHRVPIGVEIAFSLPVDGFQVRGRIDAAYEWSGPFDEIVVDWKTSNMEADELQLVVYRRAWAEARGLPIERVGAAFYHVRQDRLQFVAADDEQLRGVLEV